MCFIVSLSDYQKLNSIERVHLLESHNQKNKQSNKQTKKQTNLHNSLQICDKKILSKSFDHQGVFWSILTEVYQFKAHDNLGHQNNVHNNIKSRCRKLGPNLLV